MSSSSSPTEPPKTVVIAGAGIVGTATAYYLAVEHGIKSILVDPTGTIAPAASGKAGGFLALDWNDHSPALGRLARRSFVLHDDLASDEKFGAEAIMYRRLTCASVSVNPVAGTVRRPGGKKLAGVEWAEDSASALGAQPLGDESTIAQVHPKMLCDALWAAASKSADDGGVGSELVKGEVVSVAYDDEEDEDSATKVVAGARLADGSTVPADAVLYACGPWTQYGGLMTGTKYHSAVIPTPRVLTQSVFFSGCGDPEVYPRPDSTAYCCGFPDPPMRVTERPGEEEVREDAVERIVSAVREASGRDGALGSDPILEQSCYLPSTPDGLPLMGRVPGEGGQCYVAAGHGCWGILMGPGTGEAMAALIATGESGEVDLKPFDPSRYDQFLR